LKISPIQTPLYLIVKDEELIINIHGKNKEKKEYIPEYKE
jgi:hypothetical protein